MGCLVLVVSDLEGQDAGGGVEGVGSQLPYMYAIDAIGRFVNKERQMAVEMRVM